MSVTPQRKSRGRTSHCGRIPVTVTLSADQVNVLEALAQVRQSSLSALIRHVIAHGLAIDPHGQAAGCVEIDGVHVPVWLTTIGP